ncbi:MAG: sigma-70 family RNA polymerase sigma factor [Planctomycetales bacterium]
MDRSELSRQFEAHSAPLRLFLRGILRDDNLTDEILQRVSLKVLTSGSQARPESFRGWLFRVAWNEVQLLHRKQALEDKHHRHWAEQQRADQKHPPTFNPLDQLLSQERHGQVQQSLKQLPPEQRQVLLLRIQEDKTFAEIASELQLPLGTVVSRMQAGLKKLRQLLHDQSPLNDQSPENLP